MKVDLTVTKSDVLEELRRKRYFNEQSITRLALSETIDHKHRVHDMADLVLQNANIIEAIKLLELYFPAAQPQQAAATSPENPAE